MNRIEALKAVLTTKLRSTAHDFASLQIPEEVKKGMALKADSLSFDVSQMPKAFDFEITDAGNQIKSEEFFISKSGKRYACWLDGDESLGDEWLFAKTNYPYYHQIYKKLGASMVKPKLLEFGVRSGYAGVVFSDAIQGPKTYVGLDPNLYVKEGLQKASQTFDELRKEGSELYSFLIEGFSSSEAVQHSLLYSGPFEFIHIDGEHTYFGKLYDLFIASKLVSSNGYILVDDYDHHELVRQTIKVACYLGWFKSFSYVKTYRGMGVLKI